MHVCLEEMPEATTISDTQEVLCWLKHPMAPKVEIPEALRRGE